METTEATTGETVVEEAEGSGEEDVVAVDVVSSIRNKQHQPSRNKL